MSSAPSTSRPSTPNRSIQTGGCPGAPLRVKTSLEVSIPEGMGRVLVFPDATPFDAPDAPRAIPRAPKKARYEGSFGGDVAPVKELFKP